MTDKEKLIKVFDEIGIKYINYILEDEENIEIHDVNIFVFNLSGKLQYTY